MKLNIGSGDTRIDDFINIDYDANCNPDYVLNIERDPLPFPDSSVEQVMIHHVLEHLGEGYFHFLQELYRVCQHGAMIDIRVPHPRHQHFLDDPTHRRPITVGGMWLFSKKHNKMCREKNFSSSRLGEYYGVDFEVVDSLEVPDPNYIPVFEGQTVDTVKTYMHEHNNINIEILIKLVAIKQ